jgi:predicted class III extradiol MEMO1 family dioxygenase
MKNLKHADFSLCGNTALLEFCNLVLQASNNTVVLLPRHH